MLHHLNKKEHQNNSNSEVEITPDEVNIILDSCFELNVGGYGQVYNLLNGESQL